MSPPDAPSPPDAARSSDDTRRARLDANARQAARRRRDPVVERPALGGNDVVVVTLQGQRWGLDTAVVHGVERLGKLTALPGTPEILRGVTTSHGRVVPVFDMGRLVGGQASESDQAPRLLMVGGEHEPPFGLLVDGVEAIVALDEAALIAVDDARMAAPVRRLVRGMTHEGLIVLDAGAVLADERLVIEQHVSRASREERT